MQIREINNFENNNRVNRLNSQNKFSFRAGNFNILAFSDLHGGLRSLTRFTCTLENNFARVFPEKDLPSTKNLITVSGDYFINHMQDGYLSEPKLNNGNIQQQFFKRFIDRVHALIGKDKICDTIFTPGNHDFDGGDEFILALANKMPIKVLLTNLQNIENFKIKNLVSSVIQEVPDSINPEKKHKLLFLGATLQNMDYYNRGLIRKMKFFENVNCTDAQLQDEYFSKTISAINAEINKFKSENPQGGVVLLSHVGNRFSDLIANSTNGINLILNGHDHVKDVNFVNNVPIVSLGENAELFRGIKIHFNDDGKLEKIKVDTFETAGTPKIEVEMHEFATDLQTMLQKDISPLIKISPNEYGISELVYNKQIRYSNSPFANFLTSALRNVLRETYPELDTLGIQSSAIRGGIKHGSSNLDLLKTFDGIKINISELEIAKLKGKEIADIIIENILENLKAPERNTIMQWSDIEVNRTQIDKIRRGSISLNKMIGAIRIRNRETGDFVPLNLERTYTVALTHKFVNKEDLNAPKKIKDKFTGTGIKVKDAFRQYLEAINYNIEITPEIVENRIF